MKNNGQWIKASRPKTLTGAVAPVLIGGMLALHDIGEGFQWLPFILCLAFALVMQIDANFVNDYYDYIKGTDDEERLGPKRAVASGWITPKAMKRGIAVVTVIACLIGLPLAFYGGWWLVAIGLACVVFCFLYSTLFSYIALGDLLVIIFFGIVPVGFTYYIQTHDWTTAVTLCALANGLVTDNLLIVNNYRDIDQDRKHNKRTLVVLLGRQASFCLYVALGIIAIILALVALYLLGNTLWSPLLGIYGAIHLLTAAKMHRLTGADLNIILGATARNILIFALLLCFSLTIEH